MKRITIVILVVVIAAISTVMLLLRDGRPAIPAGHLIDLQKTRYQAAPSDYSGIYRFEINNGGKVDTYRVQISIDGPTEQDRFYSVDVTGVSNTQLPATRISINPESGDMENVTSDIGYLAMLLHGTVLVKFTEHSEQSDQLQVAVPSFVEMRFPPCRVESIADNIVTVTTQEVEEGYVPSEKDFEAIRAEADKRTVEIGEKLKAEGASFEEIAAAMAAESEKYIEMQTRAVAFFEGDWQIDAKTGWVRSGLLTSQVSGTTITISFQLEAPQRITDE